MSKYIDIHSHQPYSSGVNITLCNLIEHEDVPQEGYYTVGVHPWYIAADYAAQLLLLDDKAAHSSVIAIGETGLDKLKGAPPELQQHIFHHHISLSEELKKPLIIHCVKSYEMLLSIHKKVNPKVPWVIHRYSGNSTTAQQLIAKGIFLSFGTALFQHDTKTTETFISLPENFIFLETDDSATPIEVIYRQAALLRKTEIEILKQQLYSNFTTVFGHGLAKQD